MNTMYNGLNTYQAETLTALAKLIVARFEVERIFCFGYRIGGNLRQSCFSALDCAQSCHFYLLVIINGADRREHELHDYVSTHFEQATATVLCHKTDTVQAALNQSSYFFVRVIAYGQLLYVADGFTLKDSLPELDLAKVPAKAEKQFTSRMEKARSFFDSAAHKISRIDFVLALFMLHQAVEQTCCALIYAFMGYRTDLHNLSRLLHLCASFTNELTEIFHPNKDQRFLRLLQNSYTDARYETSFTVAQPDVETIYNLVEILLQRADAVGNKQLKN